MKIEKVEQYRVGDQVYATREEAEQAARRVEATATVAAYMDGHEPSRANTRKRNTLIDFEAWRLEREATQQQTPHAAE